MLELLLCSLLTVFPDYLYPPLCSGQAARQGNHVLLGLVRAEMGDNRLPDAHHRPDHGGVLLSSVYQDCDLFLPNRPDRSRDDRARRRDQCRHERRRRPGTAALQVGQLETTGGGRDRSPEDRGGRCRAGGRADRHPGGRGEDPGGEERPPAGPGRARDQAGAVQAQPGHRPAPRHREAPGRGRRSPGYDHGRHRGKRGCRGESIQPFSRPRRRVPRPRWPRPKWSWRRPSFVPASPDGWSNSLCASATSSIR